jgi:curved DNA-binding protein CbpA
MSANYFQLFAEKPRPWLEASVLREKFHRLSAVHHPDLPGGSAERFAELNEALRVLSDPALRLRHLLALEFPGETAVAQSAMPDPALGEHFMEIGRLQAQAKQLRDRETATRSPLAKALLAPEKAALRSRVETALATLQTRETALLGELRTLHAEWESGPRAAALPTRLAALASQFTFLAKWTAQLRETRFLLS